MRRGGDVTRERRTGRDERLRTMSVLGHGQGQGECHGPPESEVDSIWNEIAELIQKILWNLTQY